MVLTATMIGEDPHNANNRKLAAYNDLLRALVKERGCLLADPKAEMQAGLAAADEATRKQDDVLSPCLPV